MDGAAYNLRSRVHISSDGPQSREAPSKATKLTPKTEIPRYTIDLSLPPIERYKHVAKDFLPEIASLTTLFDEIVPRPFFRKLASHVLRQLYSKEQTEELRGIQSVTNIGMHLLIAFNVLLDLMMGCTSGGVRVQGDKMLHFRTLDWGMNPLRKIIVHLDYFKDGNQVASCITYVGYVGVLTGVAKGLSVSLNFRPVHNASTWLAHFRFYLHHALVLFGFRPSISSVLRDILIPKSSTLPTLEKLRRELPSKASTAAYLIFCDGERTLTFEKDYDSAIVNSSSDFIVITNHDTAQEPAPGEQPLGDDAGKENAVLTGVFENMSMNAIVLESSQRKRCMAQMWEKDTARSTKRVNVADERPLVKTERVATWMDTSPITDALTHYAVIMDPSIGGFAWEKYYPDARALWDQLIERDKIT